MKEIAETKVLEPIEQMIDRIGVGTVFGEPFKEGDTTVIPVASVVMGFGYGYGEGPAGPEAGKAADEAADANVENAAAQMAGGAGGGGGGTAKPQGYLRISPAGVTYVPIMDQGRLAIAGIAMSAWSVFWITKTIRSFAGK